MTFKEIKVAEGKGPFLGFCLGIIFIAALIIRIYSIYHPPVENIYGLGPYSDSALYHTIGYNLARGYGFSGDTRGLELGIGEVDGSRLEPAIVRGPVYPFFISAVYKYLCCESDMKVIEDWHRNWDKVRIVQAVLDASVCLVVFLIVVLIYPASLWPAFLSAFLYCFSFYNIYYTRALLTETVTTFLVSCFILFCAFGLRRNKGIIWLLTGTTFGLVSLSRTEYIPFLLVLSVYLCFIERSAFIKLRKKYLLILLGAFLVISPWTIRNYLVFNELIPVSTGGFGFNLFLGTFETRENWRGWDEYPEEEFKSKNEIKRIESLRDAFGGSLMSGTLDIRIYDRIFRKKAMNRIRSNPVKCFKCWFTRVPRLWYQNWKSDKYFSDEPSGVYFVFYFVFGIVAFLSCDRMGKTVMGPIWLLFLYLTMIFLPLHTEPRYGVALMPGIISLAGLGVYQTFSLIKGRFA